MKIILEQDELHKAIRNHVESQGLNLTNKQVIVDVTSGRGANGDTATVEISDISDVPTEPDLDTAEQNVSEEVEEEKTETAPKGGKQTNLFDEA